MSARSQSDGRACFRHALAHVKDVNVSELVNDAILDFTLGDATGALEKLDRALAAEPGHFAAWHAKAEVLVAENDLDGALSAGERAVELDPRDIHAHTTLSRIWMLRGDKERAEQHGARARLLGWKDQLKEPPPGAGTEP